ncbi:uncharacterized protein LOC113228776 [Hyposmocoma kahamanoa]|uniref:uncharacterized protein LOC113228776 n=1 Tax=Hyposmocoma kahamanoa TaxID=1477025 RepID=UPI000E6D9BA4|nr:uncharacterized protein LOC113228776 [Hyposmocoma kahamanoa]
MRFFVITLLITPVLSAREKDPVYSGSHDIDKIVVPVNMINDEYRGSTFFFVMKDYKGLYVSINGTVTKLLDDGTDVTSTNDMTDKVFFATKRGIYIYNPKKNTADKYGNFDQELIGIANENVNDTIFVLTKDKEVFKVVDNGTMKFETNYTNVDQIMLDNLNNLYFLIGKDPYVVTENEGVKKVEGLPVNPSYVKLAKHVEIVYDGIIFISDKTLFSINTNGIAEGFTGNEFDVALTAVSVEDVSKNYYAYDKKIYEMNIGEIIFMNIYCISPV